jgi:hypothetical protein
MLDLFSGIKIDLGKLKQAVVEFFSPLPTENQLRGTFPHAESCGCDRHYDHPQQISASLWDAYGEKKLFCNLEVQKEVDYSSPRAFGWSVSQTRHYLLCLKCYVRKQFQ